MMKKKHKIALLITATGKYLEFISRLIETTKKYFLVNQDVHIHVFTNKMPKEWNIDNVFYHYADQYTWPNSTMLRCFFYKTFMETSLYSQVKYDYCYAIDADAYFANPINEEIIGRSVGVQHCAFLNAPGTFETNPVSECFVDPATNKTYYGGGFYGGEAAVFYFINSKMYEYIKLDEKNGIIPIWHDESALNKYFSINTPEITLSPSYHWPEFEHGKINPYIQSLWKNQTFDPKIVFIDKGMTGKGHDFYRT